MVKYTSLECRSNKVLIRFNLKYLYKFRSLRYPLHTFRVSPLIMRRLALACTICMNSSDPKSSNFSRSTPLNRWDTILGPTYMIMVRTHGYINLARKHCAAISPISKFLKCPLLLQRHKLFGGLSNRRHG